MTERERRQKIAELRDALRQLQTVTRSDWHKGFQAVLQVKTYPYKDVEIRAETEIGYDLPRADFIILTGNNPTEFKEAIFKIFRKINIIEYKNPKGKLNRRVINKIIGYAHLLIGTAVHEKDVPEDQVTLTIFRAKKPKRLFSRMMKNGELKYSGTPGIYYVVGLTKLPFQIIITDELEGDEYAAFRALSENADRKDIERVIIDSKNEKDATIRDQYRIIVNLIAEKNQELFDEIGGTEEVKDFLMEFLKDDVDKKVNDAVNNAEAAKEKETRVIDIKNVMKNAKFTLEQAMDLLGIPQNERSMYGGLVAGKA